MRNKVTTGNKKPDWNSFFIPLGHLLFSYQFIPFIPVKYLSALFAAATLLLAGCLTTPVEKSGGMGSVTVINSNPMSIIAAAQSVFPNYGYSPAFGNDINTVSFDKNSNQLANVLWGSYGDPQTIRVKVKITPIPGTTNYRISPKVYTVSDVGVAGFQSKRPLIGLWNAEFGPLLKKVAAQASGVGAQ
ncbi:MAG: hypothetical protein K8R57_09195 [Verrucomicrobia bacterium]|nr:hypothetical protein [Verrucomicrobiota bacterium]